MKSSFFTQNIIDICVIGKKVVTLREIIVNRWKTYLV